MQYPLFIAFAFISSREQKRLIRTTERGELSNKPSERADAWHVFLSVAQMRIDFISLIQFAFATYNASIFDALLHPSRLLGDIRWRGNRASFVFILTKWYQSFRERSAQSHAVVSFFWATHHHRTATYIARTEKFILVTCVTYIETQFSHLTGDRDTCTSAKFAIRIDKRNRCRVRCILGHILLYVFLDVNDNSVMSIYSTNVKGDYFSSYRIRLRKHREIDYTRLLTRRHGGHNDLRRF